MRAAIQNTKPIIHEGKLLGVSLGFDFCAEHEWGIKGIQAAFGLDTKKLGIDKRAQTQEVKVHAFDFKAKCTYRTPEGKWKDRKFTAYALTTDCDMGWQKPEDWEANAKREFRFQAADKDLVAACWDEDAFAIATSNKEHRDLLLEAIKQKDTAIGHLKTTLAAFENSSLGVFIRSRLPKELLDGCYAEDLDYQNLQKAAKDTDIYSKVPTNRYHALSPKWLKDFKKHSETKHPVMFWLNPTGQDENNCGWYTVEELEQWMKGKGPIPKGKES